MVVMVVVVGAATRSRYAASSQRSASRATCSPQQPLLLPAAMAWALPGAVIGGLLMCDASQPVGR